MTKHFRISLPYPGEYTLWVPGAMEIKFILSGYALNCSARIYIANGKNVICKGPHIMEEEEEP